MSGMKKFLCALLAAALLCACALAEDEAPVVIGGADGPTMIFTATTSEPAEIVGEVEAVPVEVAPTATAPMPPEAVETLPPEPEPTMYRPLTGVSVGIDPGHQEHANSDTEPIAPNSSEMKQKVLSGTAGVRTGIPEYVTNLEISLQLRDALQALGATVYMTRETNDVDISNMERALMFNELGVDLALRIHCNGANDHSVQGAGTYVRRTGEKQAESELAGELILDALCEYTGAKRQGVYLRDTYTGQNWSTVPCVMVEMGYMSNPEEDEKLNDPEYQKLLVAGIAEGVRRYFDPAYAEALTNSLRQGSKGEEVAALQEKLIEMGYLDDVADGAYGPKTAAAVRAFQEANGMEATGVADAATQEALMGG